MKRGTYNILPIAIGMDVAQIKSIKFVFSQGSKKRLIFDYPSNDAIAGQNNTINLVWTQEKTFMFDAAPIEMDTFITLKNEETNPETQIIRFNMSPTLFHAEEIGVND